MKKRSVTIAGHRTSISIEEPFWLALQTIARAEGQSLSARIAAIDLDRDIRTNLSSALRLDVLAWYERRLTQTAPQGGE